MEETLYERLIEDPESMGIRDSNGCLIWSYGCYSKQPHNDMKGYGFVKIPGTKKAARVTRIIMHLEDPAFPIFWSKGGLIVDHSFDAGCRDTRCIAREHLQVTTQRMNSTLGKRCVRNKGKTSQYTGVSLDHRNNRWTTAITVDGVRRYLGRYDSEEDASIAYQSALLSA